MTKSEDTPSQPASETSGEDHWGNLASKLGANQDSSAGGQTKKVVAKLPGVTASKAKEKMPKSNKGDWTSLVSELGVSAPSEPIERQPVSRSSSPSSQQHKPIVDAGEAMNDLDEDELAAEIAAREAELAELSDFDFLEDSPSDDALFVETVVSEISVEIVATESLEDDEEEAAEESSDDLAEDKPRRRRRRGRRRRGRSKEEEPQPSEATADRAESVADNDSDADDDNDAEDSGDSTAESRPSRKRRRRRRGRKPTGQREGSSDSADVRSEDIDDGSLDDDGNGELELSRADDVEDGDDADDSANGAGESHRNIPTWLDAVGAIVDRNLEQRDKGGRSSGSSGRQSNGRRGGRRRRGGGKN